MNGNLSFYECRFRGGIPWVCGDNQTLPYAKELFALTGDGDEKTLGTSADAITRTWAPWWTFWAPGELSEPLVNFSLTIFIWYHGQGVSTCKESLPWPKNSETNHCKSNRWLIRICGTLLILSWHLRHVLQFNKLGQRAEKIFHDNLRTFNQ